MSTDDTAPVQPVRAPRSVTRVVRGIDEHTGIRHYSRQARDTTSDGDDSQMKRVARLFMHGCKTTYRASKLTGLSMQYCGDCARLLVKRGLLVEDGRVARKPGGDRRLILYRTTVSPAGMAIAMADEDESVP